MGCLLILIPHIITLEARQVAQRLQYPLDSSLSRLVPTEVVRFAYLHPIAQYLA